MSAIERQLNVSRFILERLKDGVVNGETSEIRAWCALVLKQAADASRLGKDTA